MLILRIIKNALLNSTRNLWLSGAATFVTTVTLLILTGLLLVLGVINYSLEEIKNRVDVSVYIKPEAAETEILALKTKIEENTMVRDVAYISAQEALKNFRERHAGDTALIDSLEELPENPLTATLRVRAQDISTYPQLVESLQGISGGQIISKVNYEDNRLLIERLGRMLRIVATAGLGLLLAFAVLAVLVNFNTVALAIYHRREEVEIMRLVGATNWYIRGPFLAEALIYSLIATAVSAIIIVPLYSSGLPRLQAAFGLPSDFTGFFTQWRVLLLQFTTAVIISAAASLMAIRKYLRT